MSQHKQLRHHHVTEDPMDYANASSLAVPSFGIVFSSLGHRLQKPTSRGAGDPATASEVRSESTAGAQDARCGCRDHMHQAEAGAQDRTRRGRHALEARLCEEKPQRLERPCVSAALSDCPRWAKQVTQGVR